MEPRALTVRQVLSIRLVAAVIGLVCCASSLDAAICLSFSRCSGVTSSIRPIITRSISSAPLTLIGSATVAPYAIPSASVEFRQDEETLRFFA